ncbi:hypothetical protein [Neptuniibacter caesariensis]|uniref:Uncharacterized protein n=1 Tax=Neptuniibacter caesariensis TaxID=207954 RepID=A0A7U8C6M0_NEPCE|nr:hypothetical protein [Neptuniibacter caesariensis]EAR62523.1 hypothetical protein MED92_05378 [Oceanospirillum sp. MED92] [Neptuniibacter caesariensis]
MYLAILEQFLFWGGLLVFLVSLAMYAGRTKDYKSLVEFWKPTMDMNRREFNVNRVGLTMMIAAVAIRIANFLIQ